MDLIFGVGMGSAWGSRSEIVFRENRIRPAEIHKCGNGIESAFFIPAHRSMLIGDGWASPFLKLGSETPVVARIFSQNLFERFTSRAGNDLFPAQRVLKREFRELIDSSVFHGGKVGLVEDEQHTKRLRLKHGRANLPFMTWTAGQREFTPLLLGLYHLLPPRNKKKQPEIDWVIIEEPEMGLHPKAINVVVLLVLDLLWRGYRVVLSTHSPHLLTAVWMLRRLQENKARWQLVCEALEVKQSQQVQKVAKAAMKKELRTHVFEYGRNGKVRSVDISHLDPDSDSEPEAGWGGLTAFSSKFAEAVRKAVNEKPI